jgi:hypothetical protein
VYISFLLLTTVLSFPQQVTSIGPTYQKVLGDETVKRIVTEVLNKKVSAEASKLRKLEYNQEFVTAVTDRILMTEVSPDVDARSVTSYPSIDPKTAAAEKKLREGFSQFIDNAVDFLKKKIAGPVIRLTKEAYEEYMHRPQDLQKCGEIPCNQPPCCHNCAPPPCKPSATSLVFTLGISSGA